jgi:hypothetical protein
MLIISAVVARLRPANLVTTLDGADRPQRHHRACPSRLGGASQLRAPWRAILSRARSSPQQGAHDGRQIRVVHMQAAERGLSSDSRGARTDPALPEPFARFRGPLLVSAASGTQIESAPMATMQKCDSRRRDGLVRSGAGT